MRKALQNPIVVAVLGVLALLYLLFSLRNVLFDHERTTRSGAVLPSQSLEQAPQMEEVHMEDGVLQSMQNVADSLKNNDLLSRIEWKRQANRDPFFDQNRQGKQPYWVTGDTVAWLKAVEQNKKRKGGAVAKRPLRALAKLQGLRLVAIGPGGVVAMVGDRVIRVGDRLMDGSEVIAIAPDTVWVQSAQTQQGLTFREQDSARGERP